MTTTEHLQNIPDFYEGEDGRKKCLQSNDEIEQTNPRYLNFRQKHFTAGDEEQFEYYRDAKNYNVCLEDISLHSNVFKDQIFKEWDKYKDVDATAVINTFRYIFNKFKKGIFVKIANNKLVVFLPFSKSCYTNEWSNQIKIDPKFKDLFSFLQYIHNLQDFPFPFNSRSVNTDVEQWYGNNCIIRYDMTKVAGKYYYPSEGDTNIGTIKNLLENLCNDRKVPDIEFFINRRDFPLLTKDGTEPYNNIWDSYNKPLLSHNYEKYVPILSMSTSNRFADIAMPTYEDWARVQSLVDIWFPKSCFDYNIPFNKDWNSKKPTAVFRGGSTGCGVTIETNSRLKLAYISSITPPDDMGIPYIDAGIVKWNLRPRKVQGEKYLQTINIKNLPFSKVGFLSPQEQSNYKYIINIDGHVSAFRLSLELNMGSVILMVDSEWKMWYSDFLIPYEHYVPVKADLSNLVDQIKWCRSNDSKCEEIVTNAQKFFNTYLQRNGILDYMQKTLIDLKDEMGVYLYNNEDILDLQIKKDELDSFTYDYPPINKGINNINIIPNVGRNNAILRAMQWIFNMVLDKDNLETIANKDSMYIEIKNKLSTISKWNLANFDFIIKSTTDKQKIVEHIHDAYVGINAINELTKLIPNFAYTFAYYQNYDKVNVIVEYIYGETLFDYIKSTNFKFDEYLLILIQICLALEVAQNKCGLVHYDLTPWNIILQRLEEPINVDYIVEYNKILRVKTSIIPVIIDFGKSQVIVNEEYHGLLNIFQFSSAQDIITLLIKSIDQILSTHTLEKSDFSNLMYLANFLTGNNYRKDKFTKAASIRTFMKKAGKYSCLIYDNKYDLHKLTPMDLVKYIYKLNNNYSILKSFGNAKGDYNNIMNKSNARQIYEYILSDTVEERIYSYEVVFNRVIECKLPLSSNLLLNYYAAQSIEYNLLTVYDDMLYFLEKESIEQSKYILVFNNAMKFIKKIYDKVISQNKNKTIEYNLDTNISVDSYTKEIFLEPEKVFDYLNKYKDYKINDLSDYKDIIQSIMINNGTYKLSDTDRTYYKNTFSTILNTKSIFMIINNANINTIRNISKKLYFNNQEKLAEIKENCDTITKYQSIYNKILNLLE